jgi:phosphoribosyl 1,2-cyclic phosphate phosphodiesterase
MSQAITILGCGSSGGVPRIAGGWGACNPSNPKNRRRRCSALLTRQAGNSLTRVLIDTSPDLRDQLLSVGVEHLDAVVYTHEHADHTHGIDDLRAIVIATNRRIETYFDQRTSELLHARFGYCFHSPEGSEYPPILDARLITAGREINLSGAGGGIRLLPFALQHGRIDALGFRAGAMAYTPDLNAIPQESLEHLKSLDLWIVDALRDKPHPSHFSLSEALGWIEKLKPRRAVLTNLHTDLDYDALCKRLPSGVVPAHDGLVLDFD